MRTIRSLESDRSSTPRFSSVRALAQALDLEAGERQRFERLAELHTAEVVRRDDGIAGVGVHLACRLAEAAQPGSIWVSRTVTDLVAGCGLALAPRGEHRLAGLPQPWVLYEVAI